MGWSKHRRVCYKGSTLSSYFRQFNLFWIYGLNSLISIEFNLCLFSFCRAFDKVYWNCVLTETKQLKKSHKQCHIFNIFFVFCTLEVWKLEVRFSFKNTCRLFLYSLNSVQFWQACTNWAGLQLNVK